MTARMRSNVTERAEKGLGAVSFKRLLIAGGAATMSAMLFTRIFGFLFGCFGALFIAIVVVIATQPIEGLALSVFLLKSMRTTAALAAYQGLQRGHETGLIPSIMQVSADDAVLDADDLFDVQWEIVDEHAPSRDLIYIGDFEYLGKKGLRVIASPFKAGEN